ncbi:MAG: DUF3109 family protein [Bacteroidales bacterium]|nr:DUF3109 family protein [Bacteroidales bacterium]
MVQIGDILISEEVILEFFACDYEKCRGVCCIEGDCGAPLEEYELPLLERDYSAFAPLMRPEGRAAVDEKGFFEIDIEGDLVTPVTSSVRDCAYTHYEGGAGPESSAEAGGRGNCLCAIEKCFFAGKCSFRKPQSCRLYPIRITKLTGGGLAFNLHRWNICQDAFEKGRREGIRVYQFLREPLTELYGEDFYRDLCAAAEYVIAGQEN